MDKFTKEVRSKIMSSVRGKNTIPERTVCSLLHSLGYRFRLHKKELPGSPDIVLNSRKTIIFVHGCFWHQHPNCKYSNRPKSNVNFWNKKLDRNVQRDLEVKLKLEALGWRVITVWECEIRDKELLSKNLARVLESKPMINLNQ